MNAHSRSVAIGADIETVGDYVGQVHNLPRWTTFFLQVGEAVGGKYPAETLVGPAETWIEHWASEQRQLYIICSLIRDRREQALITLAEQGQDTHLTFTLNVPETLPAKQLARQLQTLEQELWQLKQLVEGIAYPR